VKQASGALLSAIQLDRSSRRSISVQLYMALRDTILSGGLRPGERLPATRTLAREIGVSRTTVIDAVERLTAEGMVVSRVGAGTYVSDTLDQQRGPATPPRTVPDAEAAPQVSRIVADGRDSYARRTWLPHEARAFVTALTPLAAQTAWRLDQDLASRNGAACAYDELRGETILFGGYNGSHCDETWRWDGTVWTRLHHARKELLAMVTELRREEES
jgi:GntR family transcriptional regulator/MocR family aminotransferase